MNGFASGLAILLASFTSLPALGQVTIRSGAPFVAVRTMQQTNGDFSTTAGIVARSSNGSTYVELTRNGETLIVIEDVPHQRFIDLYPKRHEYQVGLAPGLKAAALLPDDPENFAHLLSTRPSKFTSDNGDVTMQIGRKKIEGLDVFGKTLATHDGRLQEDWYCPKLDVNLETKMQANGNGPDFEITITQIHLEEPDPKLFEIPSGYTQQERNREMVGRVDP
jgi:hypothetical protein